MYNEEDIIEGRDIDADDTALDIKTKMAYNISPEVFKIRILSQINEPLEIGPFSVNQLQQFDEKIEISKREAQEEGNGELLNYATQIELDTYNNILTNICEKYQLDLMDTSAYQKDLTKLLFNFFVVGFRTIIEEFFFAYIMENRKEYHREYIELKKEDNNVSLMPKKMFKEGKDSYILANILNIATTISQLDIEDDNFLNYIIETDSDISIIANSFKRLLNDGEISKSGNTLFAEFMAPLHNRMDYMINILNTVSDKLLDRLKSDNYDPYGKTLMNDGGDVDNGNE
jgi:hypothetical protein